MAVPLVMCPTNDVGVPAQAGAQSLGCLFDQDLLRQCNDDEGPRCVQDRVEEVGQRGKRRCLAAAQLSLDDDDLVLRQTPAEVLRGAPVEVEGGAETLEVR